MSNEMDKQEMQRRHLHKQQQTYLNQQQRSSGSASSRIGSSTGTGSKSVSVGGNTGSKANHNPNYTANDKIVSETLLKMEQQQQQPERVESSNVLLKECHLLLQTKQYASCELLTGYLLSSLEADTSCSSPMLASLDDYATALELFGDCVSQMSPPQFRRAVSYYNRALTAWQHNNTGTDHYHEQDAFADENNIAKRSLSVQLKAFRCLMMLKSFKEAYGILNSLLVHPGNLPERLRTFDLSMEFATLCLMIDLEKDARHWYLDALRLNPYALEAIEMLAILGTEQGQVQRAVQAGLERTKKIQLQQQTKEGGDHTSILLLVPIQDMVMAQFQAASNHNPTALSKYRSLAERFPNNIHLLSKIAVLEFHLGEYTKSEQTFNQIRKLDPYCMDHMDEYAELLRRKRNSSKLSQLSMELLQISDSRPEAWVCLALYHQSKGNITNSSNSNSAMINGEQAISFVERALRINPRYAYGHYIRGMLLLLEHMPEEAITSFHCANKIRKSVSHYEGLVEAYLLEEKYKEAVTMAKEAMAIAPKDPRTFTLIGLALSHSPSTNRDGKEKAKKAFRKALNVDPYALRPMFALADIFVREKDFTSCVELLTRAIEQQGQGREEQDMVHAKLADVFTAAENYNDAFTHYHVAISMNPENMVARRGHDRLEKLMRGLDPDGCGGPHDINSDDYDDEGIDTSPTGNFETDANDMGYL